MNCPNCGNEINENQKFCTKCGAKVEENINEEPITENQENTVIDEQKTGNNLIDNCVEETITTEDKLIDIEASSHKKFTNNTNIPSKDEILKSTSVKLPLFAKILIFVVILCIIGVLTFLGYTKYMQFQKDILPLTIPTNYEGCKACLIKTTYDWKNKKIKLLFTTDEIIEDWQVDYNNEFSVNFKFTIKDDKTETKEIQSFNNNIVAGKPLTIEFYIDNATTKDYVNFKHLLERAYINDNGKITYSYDKAYSFVEKDRNTAHKEFLKYLEEKEFKNRREFINFGETNLYENIEIESISLTNSLEQTLSDGTKKTIYPKHEFFTIINVKIRNNKKYSYTYNNLTIETSFDLSDINENRFDIFGNTFDNSKLNPGDVKSGQIFYDIPLDREYLLNNLNYIDFYHSDTTGIYAVYINTRKKEFCINEPIYDVNAIDKYYNKGKCTKAIINSFFYDEYKNWLKAQEEKRKRLEERKKQQEEEQRKFNNSPEGRLKNAENDLF